MVSSTQRINWKDWFIDCPNEAHKAWLKRKQELAILLAAEQTDDRVAKAIIDRYMNYGGTND